VIVDSYYRGALARVSRVEYILHQAYPEPIQVRSNARNRFMLKELANGEYVLVAKVFLRDRKSPLILQRYITLWKEGPDWSLAE
jgi:transcription initiation factor IIF auxiliary subunit